jgi:DNA ligase D-like protein (predicted ligase)
MDPYAHIIKPMLAEARETPFDSDDHIYELKWDGTRAIGFVRDGLRFQNRRLNFIETRYPEIRVLTKTDAILDGEIVVMDGALPSFPKLQEREHANDRIRIEYLSRTLPATYVVFDVLYIENREVMSRPLSERKGFLKDLVEPNDHVVLSDYLEGRGTDYYQAVVARGLEGIIAKRQGSRYHPGQRSRDWIKIKKKATLDCLICGVTVGEGERRDTFGSLVLGAYHEGRLIHMGRVGTGFSESLRRSLAARLKAMEAPCPFGEVPDLEVPIAYWTRPAIVCEVHFLEFSKDRHLRAPSFSRLREDKNPQDCAVSFPA